MIEKGIVSLIVPCYNGENYVIRCLKSIMDQTYSDKIELIFVNDGSTDATDQIIKDNKTIIENKLYRFIYILQDNAGVGEATNRALKEFHGEYLTTLDVDDFLMPESIEKRFDWLEKNPEYSIVFTNGYYTNDIIGAVDDSTLFYQPGILLDEERFFENILDGKAMNWSGSYMIRSRKWLKRCSDREIFPSRKGQNIQLILPAVYKEKAGYIDEPLMRYYRQSSSLSHHTNDHDGWNQFNMIYGFQEIYEKVICNICNEEDKKRYLREIRISSIHTRIGIAKRYNNRRMMKICKNELEEQNAITLNDRISIYKTLNPSLALFFRIIRKLIV